MATVGTPSANTKMMHTTTVKIFLVRCAASRRFCSWQLALSSSLNLCGLLLGRKLLTHSLIPQLSANRMPRSASLGGIDEHFPLIAAHVPLASALVNWLAADHGEHDVSRSAAFNDRRNGVDQAESDANQTNRPP